MRPNSRVALTSPVVLVAAATLLAAGEGVRVVVAAAVGRGRAPRQARFQAAWRLFRVANKKAR